MENKTTDIINRIDIESNSLMGQPISKKGEIEGGDVKLLLKACTLIRKRGEELYALLEKDELTEEDITSFIEKKWTFNGLTGEDRDVTISLLDIIEKEKKGRKPDMIHHTEDARQIHTRLKKHTPVTMKKLQDEILIKIGKATVLRDLVTTLNRLKGDDSKENE